MTLGRHVPQKHKHRFSVGQFAGFFSCQYEIILLSKWCFPWAKQWQRFSCFSGQSEQLSGIFRERKDDIFSPQIFMAGQA